MKKFTFMNKYVWLIILGLASASLAKAQFTVCGTDHYWDQQVAKNPQLEQERIKADAGARAAIYSAAYKTMPTTSELLIPIVFHVISNRNYPVQTTLQDCKDQIQRLNEDYSERNSDTVNVRPLFQGRIGNAHIRFILATKDPNGNPTTGMTRDTSILTYNAGDTVKSVVDWDHNFYLNVWVVYNIDSRSLPKGSTIAGYSVFPWDGVARGKADGIVMDHTWIGYGTDRTLTHEIGHFLGLYHTFQGGCTGGDEIEDTPPVTAASLGKCGTWPQDSSSNTCHNDVPDLPDMLENIMDYSSCKVMFTKQQVQRMRYYLTLNRVSLYYYNTVAGIETPTENSSAALSLFPNPTNESFTLDAAGLAIGKSVHIQCFDMMGRMQFEELVPVGNDGIISKQMNVASLKSGVYKVVLYQDNEMKAVKALIKQ